MVKGRHQRLPVYGPRGTSDIVSTLFDDVYKSDIRFRIREARMIGQPVEHVADIVQVHDVESGAIDVGRGVQVDVGRVEHGETALGLLDEEWSAVGYRVDGDGRAVTITGDAVGGRDLGRLAHDTDALVICCYLAGDEINTDETRFLTEHVLAGAPQVASIAAAVDCRYLVLTHLRRKSALLLDSLVAEIRELYAGEIIVAEDLFTLEV